MTNCVDEVGSPNLVPGTSWAYLQFQDPASGNWFPLVPGANAIGGNSGIDPANPSSLTVDCGQGGQWPVNATFSSAALDQFIPIRAVAFCNICTGIPTGTWDTGWNWWFSSWYVQFYLKNNAVIVCNASAPTTTGATINCSRVFIGPSPRIVSGRWRATDGVTSQGGTFSVTILANTQAISTSITFSPAFAGIPTVSVDWNVIADSLNPIPSTAFCMGC